MKKFENSVISWKFDTKIHEFEKKWSNIFRQGLHNPFIAPHIDQETKVDRVRSSTLS